MPAIAQSSRSEEQIVAELERLGVGYLSRQVKSVTAAPRATDKLLAELIRQPSSRVRAALISLLLAHPEYAAQATTALEQLQGEQAHNFKFFYTAAVHLQAQFEIPLRSFLGARFQTLPDLFSSELGVTGDSATARLESLARLHRQWNGVRLNWAGTYQSAALNLLRRWEVEKRWNP